MKSFNLPELNLAFVHLVVLVICAIFGILAISETVRSKDDQKEVYHVVAEFPKSVKSSRLLRVIDKEAGVVCYVFSNNTADMYSGLQCLKLDDTVPLFWRK